MRRATNIHIATGKQKLNEIVMFLALIKGIVSKCAMGNETSARRKNYKKNFCIHSFIYIIIKVFRSKVWWFNNVCGLNDIMLSL
jgi:hypothetical protein